MQFNQLFQLESYLDGLSEIKYSFFKIPLELNIEAAKSYRIAEDWIYKNYPFLFGENND